MIGNIWSDLMQDAGRLQKLIKEHKELDRKAWLLALPKLEKQKDVYFKTDLGEAFVQTLTDKLEAGLAERRQAHNEKTVIESFSWEIRAEDEKELEKIALWLMNDVQNRKEKTKKKKTGSFLKRFRQTAIAACACLSVCFMTVWLREQIKSNLDRWKVQQMKVPTAEKEKTFMEENPETKMRAADHMEVSPDADASMKDREKQDETPAESRPKKLPQYEKMSDKYPELYGWLQIPETQIDMPIMRPKEDREFYLHHDFIGAESAEGALFVDQKSSSWPQDSNIVIYGHNMKNGHMFGMLKMYHDKDFFQAHRKIQFDTLYETGLYEAVAVLKTRILNEDEEGFRYYQFFNYQNEMEFQKCLEFIEKNQMFGTDSTLEYGDHILMLSTCEYSQENGRLVIVARKMD